MAPSPILFIIIIVVKKSNRRRRVAVKYGPCFALHPPIADDRMSMRPDNASFEFGFSVYRQKLPLRSDFFKHRSASVLAKSEKRSIFIQGQSAGTTSS